MTTVAIFSTYAPSEAFGGPARIFHERRALESAGFDVVHVVLQPQHDSGASRGQDFVRTIERPFRSPIDHIYNDVDLGRRAATDARLVRQIVDHLGSRGTAAILLEQPFLVDVVAQVMAALRVPVVYSSQNLEFRLRADLERFQFDWKRPSDRSAEVRELEAAAVALATHVTTICPSDQTAHEREFGCSSTIVPNGSSIGEIRRSLLSTPTGGAPSSFDFVFAGSAYWPNVDGLAQVATPSLAFLPPTCRVGVVGSICRNILDVRAISRHRSMNNSRLALLGFLSAEDLTSVMTRARCVIVPIFIGEGSNLKSADALAAGVPVIMTRRATHGYEDVLAVDPEGVTVVDTADEFREAMSTSLSRTAPTAPVGRTRRDALSWPARLAPLVEIMLTLNH